MTTIIHRPKICCNKFSANLDEDNGPLTMRDFDTIRRPHLDYVSIAHMKSCYPECGPNFKFIPIDFCPFCGKKIEYVY